jgi:hypothetical protein
MQPTAAASRSTSATAASSSSRRKQPQAPQFCGLDRFLCCVAVYDAWAGQKEGSEYDKVLAFYPPCAPGVVSGAGRAGQHRPPAKAGRPQVDGAGSYAGPAKSSMTPDDQASIVGLAQALHGFSATFSPASNDSSLSVKSVGSEPLECHQHWCGSGGLARPGFGLAVIKHCCPSPASLLAGIGTHLVVLAFSDQRCLACLAAGVNTTPFGPHPCRVCVCCKMLTV